MGIMDIPMNPDAFEWARWFFEDRKYKLIGVEAVSDEEKRFRLLVQNLITDAGSMVLKTRYANEYEIKQRLFFRDKYWVIRNISKNTDSLNPQALGLVNPSYEYILELTEADKETVYHG
jgi:hypothetical protein